MQRHGAATGVGKDMDGIRDRELIGRLVEREVESRTSWARFAEAANVSRATLYRVKDGDPRITERILRRIERALALPFDSLSAVGAHDFDGLTAMGIDEGLVIWLKQNATSPATSAQTTLTTHGRPATEPACGSGEE